MSRELLQQALDALRMAQVELSGNLYAGVRSSQVQSAITALSAALAAPPAAPAPGDMVMVPLKFVQDFNTLAHNYCLRAVPPDYYSGTEADAFQHAYSRCGSDLRRLREILAAAPAPAVPLTDDIVEKEFVSRGDGRSQGLHPYWKSAFREGWHFARAMIAASPPAPAVAEPLSDERIDEIFEGAHENMPKGVLFRTFIARAIEQAHGIGGGGNG